MALNPLVWGPAVATAVKAYVDANIEPGTPITAPQISAIWTVITGAHDAHISANAQVSGTVTSGSGSGGNISGTVD